MGPWSQLPTSFLMLRLLSSSYAYLAPPTRRGHACGALKIGRLGVVTDTKATAFNVSSRRLSLCSSLSCSLPSTTEQEQSHKSTALLWLSHNRLRLRDNLALTKAAELGLDGLTICLTWPYDIVSASPAIDGITPVEAFGYAALHSLNDALGEYGQKVWLIPSNEKQEKESNDPSSAIAQTVQELRPAHVVVDVSLLDRHHDYVSKLRDKLMHMNEGEESKMPAVIEVMDDGLLIPFDRVRRALGRSRQGGRALRWSTFLRNAMALKREYDICRPTWNISSLPPPIDGDTDEIITSMASLIPRVETFPSWAQQLLSDWGDISEDEAINCASSTNNNTNKIESTTTSPELTEKGSRDTKLSPYLRWGVISPQRAAESGVRKRDLLWRDWSYICYGLLGPIRRGDAVLEFMDKSTCLSTAQNKEKEEELFKLWCVGNTGSKLVDAGMRQLWAAGWMPRRIRILSAACLVEGLGVDWRLGRDWFMHTLVDHDPAINEMMWQNAGICGVDPFYYGIKWEVAPREAEDEEYIEKWLNKSLIWPSYLKPYSKREPQLQIIDNAESNREALRQKGVYKAARRVSNAGVRVAWPGLDRADSAIRDGEVMGVGIVPVHELEI